MEQLSGYGFPVCAESIDQIESRLREFVRGLGEQHCLTSGHRPVSKLLISCSNPVIFHIADSNGHLLAELILTPLEKHDIYVDLKTDPELDFKTYVQLLACIDPAQWHGPVLLSLTEGKPLSRPTIIDNIASTLNYFIPWLARRSPSILGGVPGHDVDMEITALKGYETGITNPIKVYQELVLRAERRGLPEWRGTAMHYTLEEIAPGRIRLEVFHENTPTLATMLSLVIQGIFDTWPEARRRTRVEKQMNTSETTTILFVASDPSDLSRLRLGEEVREIGEKLQLARLRDRFRLEQRHATRAVDLTQALLDVKPNIVHFAGHGTSDGNMYLEDNSGLAHPVPIDALGALFEQFASDVTCVVLNACHSETQAISIAKHITHVIGMDEAIPDRAAVAFSVGFYQALGAGCSIEEAYRLGCIQIALQGIPEHLTPVLIGKKHEVSP